MLRGEARKLAISDREIEFAADDVLGLLKEYNPQDATSIMTLAWYKMLTAAFSPDKKDNAVEAFESNAQLIRVLLQEPWL